MTSFWANVGRIRILDELEHNTTHRQLTALFHFARDVLPNLVVRLLASVLRQSLIVQTPLLLDDFDKIDVELLIVTHFVHFRRADPLHSTRIDVSRRLHRTKCEQKMEFIYFPQNEAVWLQIVPICCTRIWINILFYRTLSNAARVIKLREPTFDMTFYALCSECDV